MLTLVFQYNYLHRKLCLCDKCYNLTEHAEDYTSDRAEQKSHSYHLCNTLSTNVLGEDKPGRYELNVKKN